MTSKTKTILISLGALAIAGIAAVLAIGLPLYTDYKKPAFTKSAELYVYPNTPVEDILACLDTVVYNTKSIKRAFSREDVASRVKPGHYTFSANNSAIYAARAVANGWQTPINFTLSGTNRLRGQLAKKISNQFMLDSAEVAAAFNDKELLASYGKTPEQLFSMFMPDTYQMYWTASMKDIFDKQKEALDAFWTEENVALAKKQGLTPMQATIVASIVKGESNYEPEFPKIAGVYLNRLHIGMKLQADPTVAYCYNYSLNRILLKHLEVESPYNTYKYAGLPPAPIQVPTKACLEAVLHPDTTPYLYFCASPDFNGSHRFAEGYAQHLVNAREFQMALNRRNRENNK